MADQNDKTSGELREAKRSSVIDQQLMNQPSSVKNDSLDDEDLDNQEESGGQNNRVDGNNSSESNSQAGEDYANVREQQNQARVEQNNQNGGGVAGKIGAVLGGSSKNGAKSPQEIIKEKIKQRIKLWILGSVASCCLPGCLLIGGFLAMSVIMLTILADPMKTLGLAFDAVWDLLKTSIGAITGWLLGS